MATSRTFSLIDQEISLPATGSKDMAQGALIVMTQNAYASTDFASGRRFMGVLKADALNAAGAAGAMNLVVRTGVFEVSCTSTVTSADIGKQLYLATVTGAVSLSSGSNAIKVGVLEQLSARSLHVWCDTRMNAKLLQDQ